MHCSSYQAMLANPLLRSKLIAYVMKAFQDFACHYIDNFSRL